MDHDAWKLGLDEPEPLVPREEYAEALMAICVLNGIAKRKNMPGMIKDVIVGAALEINEWLAEAREQGVEREPS